MSKSSGHKIDVAVNTVIDGTLGNYSIAAADFDKPRRPSRKRAASYPLFRPVTFKKIAPQLTQNERFLKTKGTHAEAAPADGLAQAKAHLEREKQELEALKAQMADLRKQMAEMKKQIAEMQATQLHHKVQMK